MWEGEDHMQSPEVSRESPQGSLLRPQVTTRVEAFTQQGPCLACSLLYPSYLAGDLVHSRNSNILEQIINPVFSIAYLAAKESFLWSPQSVAWHHWGRIG